MKFTIDKVAQLTFYAVIGYLVLVHNKGSIGLVGAVSKFYNGAVRALQGR